MKVRDRMKAGPTTVHEDDDLATALQLMLWAGIRHLPVVRGDEVVGILSERDVLRRGGSVEGAWRLTGMVGEAMTRDPQVAEPDEPLEDAAARMSMGKLGCLPVVEDDRLVGILTTTDLVAELAASHVPRRAEPPGTVREVMTPEPVTVRPDDRLLEAASILFHRGIRHLPVVDAGGRLVGMLSDRDLRSAVGNPLGKLREELRVEDAMLHEPCALRVDCPLAEAVALLVDERVGAVPILDAEDQVVGIVSYLDVLRVAAPTLAPAERRA